MAAYVDESMDKNLDGDSLRWNNWMSVLSTIRSCQNCVDKHGKIFDANDYLPEEYLTRHIRCLCKLCPMRTIMAGEATDQGINGADWYLAYYGFLPDGYITKKQARKAGWKNTKGNLAEILPGNQIGGDEYYNENGKLPQKNNRTWYEADINYESGYRNNSRILYSNDGLVFLTHDHYKTFYEIIK